MAKTKVNALNVSIREGCIYGVLLTADYDTRLFEKGPKAKVRGLTINLDGMPVDRLVSAAWGHLKVQRQQAERGSDDIESIEAYSGQEISWAMIGRKLISKKELEQQARSAVATLDEKAKLELARDTMQGMGLDTTDIELKLKELFGNEEAPY
jgi:hypothetical protein